MKCWTLTGIMLAALRSVASRLQLKPSTRQTILLLLLLPLLLLCPPPPSSLFTSDYWRFLQSRLLLDLLRWTRGPSPSLSVRFSGEKRSRRSAWSRRTQPSEVKLVRAVQRRQSAAGGAGAALLLSSNPAPRPRSVSLTESGSGSRPFNQQRPVTSRSEDTATSCVTFHNKSTMCRTVN